MRFGPDNTPLGNRVTLLHPIVERPSGPRWLWLPPKNRFRVLETAPSALLSERTRQYITTANKIQSNLVNTTHPIPLISVQGLSPFSVASDPFGVRLPDKRRQPLDTRGGSPGGATFSGPHTSSQQGAAMASPSSRAARTRVRVNSKSGGCQYRTPQDGLTTTPRHCPLDATLTDRLDQGRGPHARDRREAIALPLLRPIVPGGVGGSTSGYHHPPVDAVDPPVAVHSRRAA